MNKTKIYNNSKFDKRVNLILGQANIPGNKQGLQSLLLIQVWLESNTFVLHRGFKNLGWCLAGSILPYGEKVPP